MIGQWLLIGIFGIQAALHFYWAAGGRAGLDMVIPRDESGEPLFEPPPSLCGFMGLIYVASAGVVAVPFDPGVRSILLKGMATACVIRALGDFHYIGLLKRFRNSLFALWDTRVFSPLCLIIAGLLIFGVNP
jgi:hypothetical protein